MIVKVSLLPVTLQVLTVIVKPVNCDTAGVTCESEGVPVTRDIAGVTCESEGVPVACDIAYVTCDSEACYL